MESGEKNPERAVTCRWLLESATWLLLGSWLGSWGLFAFVIAPTAFQVLPGPGAAAQLVGPVLASLHHLGIIAGAGVALANVTLRRPWPLWAAPIALAVLCVVTEYGITAAIHDVQPSATGPEYDLDAARRFGQLHQASRAVFGTVLLGVAAVMVAQAWPHRTKST